MLLVFLSMAIPIATGTVRTSAQLARNSGSYERTLTGEYEAASGIEVALHDVLYDAAFDDGLDLNDPPVTLDAVVDGETIPVIVTKLYPQGYANPAPFTPDTEIVVTKSVTPNSGVSPGTPTDYTYTISMENTGTQFVDVTGLTDQLPLGLTYKGPTSGITDEAPTTQTIAGREVLRWDFEEGFTWLTQADDISLSTTDTWTDIDVSALVPPNASGAVVEVMNTDNSTHRAFVKGKEDTRDYTSGLQKGRLRNDTHRWHMLKLDSNKVIQGWVDNVSIQFKLLGYTVGDDPLYFAAPPDVSIATTTSAWKTIDVSAQVDGDADGVILLVYSTDNQDEEFAIREVGSAYSQTTLGLRRYQTTMYVVGLNGAKQFEAWVSDTNIRLYLMAQTKGTFVYLDPYIPVADPSLGSWESFDADDYGIPAIAGGLIMHVESPAVGRMAFRHGDSYDNWGPNSTEIDNDSLFQAPVGINVANEWDEYMEFATDDVYIAAYVEGIVTAIAPGQTLTLSFVATGTLGSGDYTNQAATEFRLLGCRATSPTATIDVTGGSTDPDKVIVASTAASPSLGVGFESETYTFTMTVTNIAGGPSGVVEAFDQLPQFFDYVSGSSLMNASPIADPTVTLDPTGDADNDRQTLNWSLSTSTLSGGSTLTLTFKATATLDSGDYDNEGWVETDHDYFPCVSSGASSRITVSNVLNIESDATNRGVKTRVHWWKPQGQIDIISWQE